MARAKFTPPDPVFDQPPPAGFNIRAGVKGFALLYWGASGSGDFAIRGVWVGLWRGEFGGVANDQCLPEIARRRRA